MTWWLVIFWTLHRTESNKPRHDGTGRDSDRGGAESERDETHQEDELGVGILHTHEQCENQEGAREETQEPSDEKAENRKHGVGETHYREWRCINSGCIERNAGTEVSDEADRCHCAPN